MKLPDYRRSYEAHFAALEQSTGKERAMSLAVGGDFEAVGRLEFALLRHWGLEPDMDVCDVGCGSGRLAVHLHRFLTSGSYLGTDVLPELLAHARVLCPRGDFRFEEVAAIEIPAAVASFDYCCFFSVFTHLMHAESFRYWREVRRVLRPGGRFVFSFLEFANAAAWMHFESYVDNPDPDKVLNQFLSRDAVEAWADQLGFAVEEMHDGSEPFIPLEDPVVWDDGNEMREQGALGQSVALLRRL
jgi:SAM-dependent methyltransferase